MPTTVISAFIAPDTSSMSVLQLRLAGRGMQSELAFSFPHGSQRPPCLADKIPQGYVSTVSAEGPKLAQHKQSGTRNGREGQQMYPCSLCRTSRSPRAAWLCKCSQTTSRFELLSLHITTWVNHSVCILESDPQVLRQNFQWSLAEGACNFVHRHWIHSSSCGLSNLA